MNILPPPGPQRRRQLILLGVCLAGLAFVVMRYWQPDGQAAAPPATSNPQTAQGATGAAPVLSQLPEPLKLGALEPVPEAPEAGRNPFRFGVRPPPPAPPPPPTPQLPPQPVGPPPPPPIPQIPLDVVGMISMPDGRTLVSLKDSKTGAVFQAFEGQIVDGRFRLAKVGVQSVVVTHLDGTNARTLVAR